MKETVICEKCFCEYDPEENGNICPLCNHDEDKEKDEELQTLDSLQ